MKVGESLVKNLKKGSIVALEGPLGAGKTCFAKGIASGLGITEEVTSPTYTIISEYSGVLNQEKIAVYHIDAYRLSGNEDFYSIGGEEIVFGNGISIIEWSERIPDFIPSGALKVAITITKDDERHIRVCGEGNGEYPCH